MSISRRFFLGGGLAVAATSVMQPQLARAALPVMHADGLTDDSPAIWAMMRGEPFQVLGDVIRIGPEEPAILRGTSHFISRMIDMRQSLRPLYFYDVRLRTMKGFSCPAAIHVGPGSLFGYTRLTLLDPKEQTP